MGEWREGLAGAAWFFNGEGHVGSSVGKFKGGSTRRDLYLTISQTDRWVLDKFREFVGGLGRVSGPFVHRVMERRGNEQPRYYFQTTRFEHIQAIIAMMWPWLSPIKKAQATSSLAAMRLRSSHRQTCRHGHVRTPENISWSGGRRHCQDCKRDQMRHLRLVRKTAVAMLVAS